MPPHHARPPLPYTGPLRTVDPEPQRPRAASQPARPRVVAAPRAPAPRAGTAPRTGVLVGLLLLCGLTAGLGVGCAVTGSPVALLASLAAATGEDTTNAGSGGAVVADGVTGTAGVAPPAVVTPTPVPAADPGTADPAAGSPAPSSAAPAAATTTTRTATQTTTQTAPRATTPTTTPPPARPATRAPAAPASPSVVAAGAPAPAGATATEAAVLQLVNQQRAAAGCPALTVDARLAALARAHSADMRDRHFFDHTNPDGLSPFDRAHAAGITTMRAENIAMGQPTPAAVMTAWMNSPGHRANILDCSLRSLGVGVAEGTSGPWWTQDFGV